MGIRCPVTVLAFDDSMEMSIAMTRDLFYAAALAWLGSQGADTSKARQQVLVASPDGKAVRSFSGSECAVDVGVNDIDHSDLIVVSGVWGDIDHLLDSTRGCGNWIRHQYEQGATIACLHTGTFIVAETGLLDAKAATIYWRMVDSFQRRYPKVILQAEKNITSADRLYCSAGVTSAVEMASYLIEKMWGAAIATKVARHFLMDIPRVDPEFTLGLDRQKAHADERIHAAQQWMEAHFSSTFMLDEVADKVGLSLRSLRRRFKSATQETPMQYLHRVRLETAKNLLANSALGVDQIAYRIGYEDANYFSRLFRKKLGLSPSEYRVRESQITV